MILADAPMPDPASIASWLAVALFLIGCVGAVMGVLVAWRALRPKPTELMQPIEVRRAAIYIDQAACEERHRALAEEMGGQAKQRARVYEQQESQARQIEHLTTEAKAQTSSLADLKLQIEKTNDRIDTVPERVINLLQKTKGLI